MNELQEFFNSVAKEKKKKEEEKKVMDVRAVRDKIRK